MILSRIARPAQGLHVPVEKVSYFFFPHTGNKIIRCRQEGMVFVHSENVVLYVMVITQDSESCDPGSSPGMILILYFFGQQLMLVVLTCAKQ